MPNGTPEGGNAPPKCIDNNKKLPVCVDLDGTLIANDTTWMAVRLFLKQRRSHIFYLIVWFLRGLARFKSLLFARVEIDINSLPYNRKLIEFLEDAKKTGSEIYLVTATDEKIAKQIYSHFADLFSGYYASDGKINLRHKAKANLLIKIFGDKQFIYAGNSKDDLAVWKHARQSIVVSSNRRLINKVDNVTNVFNNHSSYHHNKYQ